LHGVPEGVVGMTERLIPLAWVAFILSDMVGIRVGNIERRPPAFIEMILNCLSGMEPSSPDFWHSSCSLLFCALVFV
jgi:ABC-type antimicrobial peptide transport system permease subunit